MTFNRGKSAETQKTKICLEPGIKHYIVFMHPRSRLNLPGIGRLFYGIAITAMGLLTLCYHRLPYMMIPQNHPWLNEHMIWVYISGVLLLPAGICIILEKKLTQIAFLLGAILLAIFFFYFIPYELTASPNYKHFGDWENAAKELSLASGALVLAGPRWRALGISLYALTMISYGIDHFLYAKQAVGYVPSWVPYHLFWLYFCGAALFCSGFAILLNIKRRLAATMLGIMIFIWVVILHIPYALSARNEGEITSAFLALGYCGIAFMITHPKPTAVR